MTATPYVFAALLLADLVLAARVNTIVRDGRTRLPEIGMAGGVRAARVEMGNWATPRENAAEAVRAVRWDFAFIACYAVTLAWGSYLAGRSYRRAGWGAFAAIWWVFLLLAVATAAVDAGENYALLQVVGGSGDERWPRLARAAGVLKCLLPAPAILYVFAGGLRRVF